MEFLILGPLEVRVGGEPLALGGPKQRGLLAILLLNANRVVSRTRLIDELWCDRPGPAAQHALDVQVSRLRKVLGSSGSGSQVLETRPPGYLLHVADGDLDLERFRDLCARAGDLAAAGDREQASRVLREAESLWRGRPLADLELEQIARSDVGRLEEVGLATIEQRIDADLALGRHHAVVAELEALVAESPLREGLRGQLMLALYRCGRQAEALEAYRAGRAVLVSDLGLEPTARLREIERSILTQEPHLDDCAPELPSATEVIGQPWAPVAPGTTGAPSADRAAARSRRRRIVAPALGAAVVAIAAVAAAATILLSSATPRRVSPLTGGGVVLESRDGGRLAEAIPLATEPTDVSTGFGALWVSDAGDGTVTRVDSSGAHASDVIQVGAGPSAIAAAGGALWVANTLDGTLSRIDPATDRVTQTVAVGRLPAALVSTGGALWVADRGDGTVRRVDPVAGRVDATIDVGAGPSGIAVSRGTLWVANESSGTVSRIDPGTDVATQTIKVGDAPSAIAATSGGVWVLDRLDATISRLDPRTEAVTATIAVSGGPSDLTVSNGAVWVSNETTGTVSRIDDGLGAVTATTRVGERTTGLTVTREGVWATVSPGGPSHRGGTLQVVASSSLDSLDPAFALESGQLVEMTNDGLVALDHVSGARGAQLVPDLALSLPAPSRDQLTYSFRIRSTVRYSTGALVKPSDVRHSLERLYALRSPARPFYDAIVGTTACDAHPRHCNLARGIDANDRAHTVTFHLRSPDPDFLYKLALPYAAVLPASTPIREAGGARAPRLQQHPRLPATGPYMVAQYVSGRRVWLTRNPYYREWSRAAQPQGYPDRIELTLGHRPDQGAALVERGAADFMSNVGPPPAGQRAVLRRREPSRLRVNGLLATDFFFLNTHARPFDDVRVRRAVNDALDRRRMVGLYGGPSTARVTCQLLPPQVPGYQPYCPYTGDPGHGGHWRRPDLAKAKRLVARSGTSGMRVIVWDTATPQVFDREGHYVAAVLARLGYRASVRLLPDGRFFDFTNNSRNHAQVISGGWSLDYPAASSLFTRLTCPYFTAGSSMSSDASEFCDPALDRQIHRATALQATGPDASARLWAHVDRQFVDRAIWLPTVTPTTTDILSRRVGNYQYQIVLGAMLDQLWVQ